MKPIPIVFRFFLVEAFCQYYPRDSEDFLFTLVSTAGIRAQEDFSLLVTLQESSTPVTFNITFTKNYSEFLKFPKIQLTLNPGEARKVLIEVKDNDYFQNNNGSLATNLELEVIAFQRGQYNSTIKRFEEILYICSKEEIETSSPEKPELVVHIDNASNRFKTEMTINYQVLAMKNHSHLLQKPLLISSQLEDDSGNVLWKNETRIEKGHLIISSVKVVENTNILRITANGEDFSLSSLARLGVFIPAEYPNKEQNELKLEIETNSALPIYNTKTNVTFSMLRSLQNIPVAGSCEFNVFRANHSEQSVIRRNFTLDWETGRKQFEVNLIEDLNVFMDWWKITIPES